MSKEREAIKFDQGTEKLPWDLLPFDATEGMVRVLLYGQRKYTICKDCVEDFKGKFIPTRIYPNPRLNGDQSRDNCPRCGSKNLETGSHNWRKGFAWSRLVASSFRHLKAFCRGEMNDPESGELHVYHLMCCVAFLAEHITENLGKNDLYHYGVK